MGSGLNLRIDPALPIAGYATEIAELIKAHPVVVVAGETGSGKTTQLPKICLSLARKSIGHTQPRRIAARSVATRIAQEISSPLGQVVGYQVRFSTAKSDATQLKVMTDGILLAEISHDRLLSRYDTIIIDEAHERSLNIDFLLGYLKRLLQTRTDLKVIITSATIDTARFSAHFDNAPIVEIKGRTYPVEVRYSPLSEDDDLVQAVVAGIASLPRHGDILVFCSGEREIKDLAKAISQAKLPRLEVLPLFARLTIAEQSRVFSPHQGQRVVLATNVAETSLTVPGIRYVIDLGFARISRYSARTKVQRLPIEPISQASANQRAGRCGRLGPGIALRLYSEQDYKTRPMYTEPEILRTNLAAVILAMANAQLGLIEDFPFVESPDKSLIGDGIRLLTELGAITGDGLSIGLTALGRKMAMLPVDPRLSRILLEAAQRDCLREAGIIVAALSIQDVRERPQDKRELANASHLRFAADKDSGADFGTLLRLWAYLRTQRKQLSNNQFRKLCRAEYFNYLRVQEWQDLVVQLRRDCKQMNLPINSASANIESVLTSCLSGLLSNIGALDQRVTPNKKIPRWLRQYNGTRGTKFSISPGSVLAKVSPDLVMAVELVETTRLWAHTVAAISADQVEQVGSHLIKRSYTEPFFSASTGTVLASESLSLLGVPLLVRPITYAKVDPLLAREVFIRSGLVEDMALSNRGSSYASVRDHNSKLRAEIEDLEAKSRRRDLLVDDEAIFAFFDSRIPDQVSSIAGLEKWLKHSARNCVALKMTRDDLVEIPSAVNNADYPDSWTFGLANLELDYRFLPGDDRDGVAVEVPLAALSSLDPAPFSWGIPGHRLELATELIRTLPKSVRTQFVPAPNWAQTALDWLENHGFDQTKPFTEELSRALLALSGRPVSGWDPTRLPEHLKMGFLVTSKRSTTFSRDLGALQTDLVDQVQAKLVKVSSRAPKSGTSWVFGTIEEQITMTDQGMTVVGFPALKDDITTVSETMMTNLETAENAHRYGLTRLANWALPEPYKWIVAHMSNHDKIALANSPYPSVPALLADARFAAILELIDAHDPWSVRDQARFQALIAAIRPKQVDSTQKLVFLAGQALHHLAQVRLRLDQIDPDSDLAGDVQHQIDNLIFHGFLHVIPPRWLARLPVWLEGVEMRLEAAIIDPVRDQTRMMQLDPVLDSYAQLMCDHQLTAKIDDIGYLIEEFRLQVFAQRLHTIVTVSAKRILEAINGIKEDYSCKPG